MSRYDISKHPDYSKTEESRAWFYILIAIIVILVIWLLSKIK